MSWPRLSSSLRKAHSSIDHVELAVGHVDHDEIPLFLTMPAVVDVFSVLSSCTSIVMMLSLVPTVYRIQQTRHTGQMSITPMVAMVINYQIWALYGFLAQDFYPLFATMGFGVLVAVSYISIYYRYLPVCERAAANKLLACATLLLAILTAYAVLGCLGYTGQPRDQVATIMGYIGIAAVVALYSSPFESLGLVLRHRTGAFIPIHMVTAGAVNNGTWIIYSALTGDWFVLAPNIFVFSMGLAQMAIYCVFHPSTHPLPPAFATDESLPDAAKDIESSALSVLSPTSASLKLPKVCGKYLPASSPLTPLHQV